jgi:hypothetical protein
LLDLDLLINEGLKQNNEALIEDKERRTDPTFIKRGLRKQY